MSRPCQITHDESVFAGSIVPLLIGKSICPVYIHLRILRARSPFFEPLLADWSEGDDETILLPDVDPSAFDQFLGWLYTDGIDLRRRNGEWMSLCRVLVLAEKFQVPALQNRVIEAFSSRLYQRSMSGLDLRVLAHVYEETTPQSMLRRIFVYICVWFGNDHGFADLTSELPPEFHTEYALQQAKKGRMEAGGELEGDAWDLTRFLVKEGDVKPCAAKKEDVGTTAVKKENVEGKAVKKERKDSVTEERKTKRKEVLVERSDICSSSGGC